MQITSPISGLEEELGGRVRGRNWTGEAPVCLSVYLSTYLENPLLTTDLRNLGGWYQFDKF